MIDHRVISMTRYRHKFYSQQRVIRFRCMEDTSSHTVQIIVYIPISSVMPMRFKSVPRLYNSFILPPCCSTLKNLHPAATSPCPQNGNFPTYLLRQLSLWNYQAEKTIFNTSPSAILHNSSWERKCPREVPH